MMKIIQINAVYPNLSTGNLCYEIEKRLVSEGHECITIYGQKNGDIDTAGDKCFNSGFDRRMHAFLSRLIGIQGHFSKIATIKMIRFIKEYNPDLVCLGNLHANFVNIPALMRFFQNKKIPVIVSLFDCFFFTGKCTHYIDIECQKWRTGCCDCPKLKGDNKSWLFDCSKLLWNEKKNYFSALDKLGVICPTNWVANDASQSLLKCADVIKRIYYWTDTDLYKPHDASYLREKLNIKDKKVILGVSAIWTEHKGIHIFMELSKIISKDYVIVMVGRVDNEEYPPNENIIFVGSVMNKEELSDYYSMADIYMNPSIAETFGLTYVEAMASGTPSIVYDSLAARELVGTDGRLGMTVEKNDAELYYKGIQDIVKRGKAAYSSLCRSNAVKLFNKESVLSEYISFIEEIVAK